MIFLSIVDFMSNQYLIEATEKRRLPYITVEIYSLCPTFIGVG